MQAKTKVLIVGMLDSIHLARWLEQFKDENIHFFLFPSSPMRKIHPRIESLITSNQRAIFDVSKLSVVLAPATWLIDKVLRDSLRASWLRILVSRFQPSVVHCIELQNAGYLGLRAFEGAKSKPHIIVTNYGSDIFWFSRKKSHRRRLVRLLRLADGYAAECARDVTLARELGYSGKVFPIRPNSGGFSEDLLQRVRTSRNQRKIIMVKGYQGWVGRAHLALASLESLSEELRDYEVVVFSCNFSTLKKVKKIQKRNTLNIRCFGKGELTHSRILELFSKAVVYVGISMSDGISTSMLEAMAMGAIPVQTSSACCAEWFDNSGISVETLDVESVKRAILLGLELAADPINREINWETIRKKASAKYVVQASREFYG